jgi:acyl-CoA oxidase
MCRKVTGTHGQPTTIISFRTQQLPILYTLAQVFSWEAFSKDAAERFVIRGLDPRAHYGIAAVMVHHVQSSLFALAERCGAQGLFEENQIIESQVRRRVTWPIFRRTNQTHIKLETRGTAIAEGDVLALCIRKCRTFD